MPLPVRSLPTVQQWDCHGCSDCCRTYAVRVSDAEREAILKQGWMQELKVEPIVRDSQAGGYRLNHTPDGVCVFLDEQNRCKIHGRFGSAAKPLACRLYPFVLIPGGDHWRVGIRYACPSAAANRGGPLTQHVDELTILAAALEAEAGEKFGQQPPAIASGRDSTWEDLLRFNKAFLDLLAEEAVPLELRLRRIAQLQQVCMRSNFANVREVALTEFLQVMSAVVREETPLDPRSLPRPGWAARMLFRQQLAIYSRKDNGPNPGIASRSRWTRFKAAWGFARGKGRVPRLHGLIPTSATFAKAEQPGSQISPAAEAMLARYYTVKLGSWQFFGTIHFGRSYWEGLTWLLLTFPAILWLVRVFTSEGRSWDEAIEIALRQIDDSFGFNPLLGSRRQGWATRTILDRQEIGPLIAWYAR